jgi:hypothetical protein
MQRHTSAHPHLVDIEIDHPQPPVVVPKQVWSEARRRNLPIVIID